MHYGAPTFDNVVRLGTFDNDLGWALLPSLVSNVLCILILNLMYHPELKYRHGLQFLINLIVFTKSKQLVPVSCNRWHSRNYFSIVDYQGSLFVPGLIKSYKEKGRKSHIVNIYGQVKEGKLESLLFSG